MLKEEQIKCIKISPFQIKAGINYMRGGLRRKE